MLLDAKTGFEFTKDGLIKVANAISKYPDSNKGSAVMELLYIAQDECGGWIPTAAMDEIAKILGISKMRVYEVANFYSMYNLAPVGKYVVNVCRTTPCWLCGSVDILATCKELLSIDLGETTEDGMFTLREVECLGACTEAPVVQVNNKYYEKMNKEKLHSLFEQLRME